MNDKNTDEAIKTPLAEGDSEQLAESTTKTSASLKFFTLIALAIIFIVLVTISIAYISKEADDIPQANQKLAANAPGILSPKFTPNSVKFASKEDIRIYTPPEPKKTGLQLQQELMEERKAARIKPKDTTKADNSLLPPFLKSTLSCFQVDEAKILSLVKSESSIKNFAEPAFWTVFNKTENSLAIVVNQGGKDIVVAFIPPNESLNSRIPASNLTFNVRYARGSCVQWNNNFGVFSKMPPMVGDGEENKYLNAVFETTVFDGQHQLMVKTTLVGYTE